MINVKRYCAEKSDLDVCWEGSCPEPDDLVMYADFDRVTAERDALQALLTAADELNDVQSWSLLEVVAACDLAMSAMDDDKRGANFVKIIAAIKAKAALKLAEPAKDEHVCTGCGSKLWMANCSECVPY